MPPRRPKVEPKDEPDLDAEEAEETPKPKKKRAAPKPKKEVKDEPDEDDANDPDADETPKKRVRKSKKRTEPWTTEQGWTAIPPGLLTRCAESCPAPCSAAPVRRLSMLQVHLHQHLQQDRSL